MFIKASPERIWQAITTPEATERYFHRARITNTRDGHIARGPDGSNWGDGAVTVFDPPRRLVHEWRSLYDPDLAEEKTSRVTWEIEPQDGGYCKLTLTHDQLDDSPKTAESVFGDGWMFVLSGLKTLLETGEPLS
ncbi:ATPase [Acrocarpospora corrugata]|uniref:ATPase n=1 Tax=Acrocarpospora corrugata TaxID=35763 RepID=A0A5M3VU97_9ACTN|nr:ATPase [Acrocarpospora corrugata]